MVVAGMCWFPQCTLPGRGRAFPQCQILPLCVLSRDRHHMGTEVEKQCALHCLPAPMLAAAWCWWHANLNPRVWYPCDQNAGSSYPGIFGILLPPPPRIATSPPCACALLKVVDCLIGLLAFLPHPEDSLRGGWGLITSRCSHQQSLLT